MCFCLNIYFQIQVKNTRYVSNFYGRNTKSSLLVLIQTESDSTFTKEGKRIEEREEGRKEEKWEERERKKGE